MLDLASSLGSALVKPPPRTRGLMAAAAPPTVFQMADLPFIVDPATYANPRGNTNPKGNLLALRALRDLVDPPPAFTRTYQAAAGSIEGLWGSLLDSVRVIGDDELAISAVAAARKRYAEAALPSTDGTPGSWRPVYANPPGWSTLVEGLQHVAIDLTGAAGDDTSSHYATIGGSALSSGATVDWRVVDANGVAQERPIDSRSTIRGLEFDVVAVKIERPWLDQTLFRLPAVTIKGQRSGLFSTGRLDENDGLLPLVPTGFWVAANVRLHADLSAADRKLVSAAGDDAHVTLGGVAVAGTDPATGQQPVAAARQVIAWTSSLVPRWPQ